MSPKSQLDSPAVAATLRAACARVAPLWPLDRFVAVNPYLGLSAMPFDDAARELRAVAGARGTLSAEEQRRALGAGEFSVADVREVAGGDADGVLERLHRRGGAVDGPPTPAVATVADVALELTGEDWPRFVTERVSAWAAAYFDEGQAAWRAARLDSPFADWRAEAVVDRTPELMGLPGFRAAVARHGPDALAAAATALRQLEVPAELVPRYLHRLLLRVGGWAGYAARLGWDRARLEGRKDDDTLLELLCVLLVWEVALLEVLGSRGLASRWALARERQVERDAALEDGLVLQAAREHAAQARLVARIDGHRGSPPAAVRPAAQVVFCIDVRSEVFRRAVEAVDGSVETLGFAGFFGFTCSVVPLGHEAGNPHVPVLLPPAVPAKEVAGSAELTAGAVRRRRLAHQVERAWQGFKMGAVSCFSFVGPVGLAYLPRLFTDAFGITRPVPEPAGAGLSKEERRRLDVVVELPLQTKVEVAAGALGAMSLTEGFARLVVFAGHGSTTVNNPHGTGLDCGACGGRTGEASARAAAAVLNEPAVREGLAARGIAIPADTVFLAGQHDTTTDRLVLFGREGVPASHGADLAALEDVMSRAGARCREERAPRLGVSREQVHRDVVRRSRDWAEVRPEWALAGCAAFIAAPRHRTRGLDLGGRAFLHSYRWQDDAEFKVLELIMTAPVVVASWINLQYFGSTVDPELFGAGNKTLHNVVGTLGVLEGNAGDLRPGLPWQSVHDGERLQHQPVRLQVVIEAPREAMDDVIRRHEGLRQLVDNGWIHLLAMDGTGRVSHRYGGGLRWVPLGGPMPAGRTAAEAQPAVG